MNAQESPCDILALSPHPDDADLFCGASLASWAREGRRVRIVDLTAGELGSNGTMEERRLESLAAADALGLDGERAILGLPDGGIDHRSKEQLRRVVALLRRLRPRLVLAPWREDRHPDHREASRLAQDACFWAGVANFLPDAVPARRPERLLYYPCHAEAPVDLLLDVGEGIEAWQAAIDCYASQVEAGADRRPTYLNRREFRSGLRARRRLWGERAGVVWAEGFVSNGAVALSPGCLFGAGRGEADS